MNKAGRKTKYEELQIVSRLAELSPKVFKFYNECLDGGDKADKKWAADQVNKLLGKAVPQSMDMTNDGKPFQITINS